MKANTALRWAAALLAAAMLLTGCGKAAPSSSATASPTPAPDRPEVTAAPKKVAPPAVARYEGYMLRLKPVKGPVVVLQEPIGAQLIMDAYSSQRLRVPEAVGKFNNKLEVLDPSGEVRYRFSLASDGQLLMKAEDGQVFHAPEYIYYLMENNLWSYEGTLMDTPLQWQPENGTTQLEVELPRLIKTSLLPAFGYASAYFCTYKIYGVNTETRDTAKVYLLVTYAGYDIDRTYFSPGFLHTTPVTMILTKTDKDWRLTGFKQPPATTEKNKLYNNVRTIFPFEHMETVLDDLKTLTGDQVKDITGQAAEYLNDMGIRGLTVES